MRLANLEARQAFGLFLLDLDVLDIGMPGAAADEGDHPLDRIVVALEHRLNRAVRAIRDPSRNPGRPRLATRRVAEEDALNASARNDSPPTHATTAVNARNSYATFAATSAVP